MDVHEARELARFAALLHGLPAFRGSFRARLGRALHGLAARVRAGLGAVLSAAASLAGLRHSAGRRLVRLGLGLAGGTPEMALLEPPGRGAPSLVARLRRESAPAEDAGEVARRLEEEDVRRLRDEPGNRGVLVLRSVGARRAEFLVLSLWEGMEAARAPSGDGPPGPGARVFARDPEYLSGLEAAIAHYDVASAVVRGPVSAAGPGSDRGRRS